MNAIRKYRNRLPSLLGVLLLHSMLIGVLAIAFIVVRNVPAWPSRDRQESASEPAPASVPVGEAAVVAAD